MGQTVGKRLTIFAVALALSSAATAAPLDPLGDPAQFQRDVAELNRKPLPDGEPLARVVGAAVAVDARQRGRCTPNKISIGALSPVTLDGMITSMVAAGQIENAWLTAVKLDDCPPAAPIRVLLLRMADGVALQGIFAGQGESLAWPTLAREALKATVPHAVNALRRADPACAPKDLTATDVKVADRSPDLGPDVYGLRLKGSWREIWTFEPCGHRITVPISFTANGTGGASWDIDGGGIVYVP
ncbi:hypothetical protein [Sphingomonas sp. Root710]|uniref:hypothetical protein n=1 Tax=Sphingomonas sp. Root710 TaxID=1736594 RepID=UPI000A78C2E8|nr:hypothetical protein [Sphingomonas sp. Root710]